MTSFPEIDPQDRRLVVTGRDGKKVGGQGDAAMIGVAFTELRPDPVWQSPIDTQLMYGEKVSVYGSSGEWSLVQAERDRYTGWLETASLDYKVVKATHKVCVPRSFFYPEPDFKKPHKGMRSMGCELNIVDEVNNRGSVYSITHDGYAVYSKHICPVQEIVDDYVSTAERLLSTPYLWAGTTAFGLDCSGLVKLAMFMSGKNVLRDSDLQAASIGDPLTPGNGLENVRRGDLVFWNGHVGICQGRNIAGDHMLIHANAHSMDVSSEPLQQAIDRIAYLYGEPTGYRRP